MPTASSQGGNGFFFHFTREGDVPVVHVALDGTPF